MQKNKKIFKPPPKKFQPRGMTIIYEDYDLIVVDKTSGLLTVGTEKIKDNTAIFYLNQYVKKGNYKSKNEVFVVHRLDRDTSGILVFAKSKEVKSYLQTEWQEFTKTYYAVIDGQMILKEGVISSYLTESPVHKVYSTPDQSVGKLSKTGYKVIKETETRSLVEIDLITGRKNQIRAHFSEKGHAVLGDKVYGKKDKSIKRLALHAAKLTLIHPHSKEKMTFEAKLPDYFKNLTKAKPLTATKNDK